MTVIILTSAALFVMNAMKTQNRKKVQVMVARREFEMSEDDLTALMDASKPTPAMYLTGGEPMTGTPQENANSAWRRLAGRLGFSYMTVQPVPAKGDRFFTAIPIPKEGESDGSER